MALGIDLQTRENMLDEITALIDAGTAGFLRVYTSPRPATGGAATTLLAELTMNVTSFEVAGTTTAGAMTANAITGETSATAGTASWFRIVDSAGAAVVDGDVGTSGSDLNLNTTVIGAGVTVDVTSLVLTAGNP